MKTLTRAVVGACIAIGALVGVANVASADPTIVTIAPEPEDATKIINSDLVDRVDSTEVGHPNPLPSRSGYYCDVYVHASAAGAEAEACVIWPFAAQVA